MMKSIQIVFFVGFLLRRILTGGGKFALLRGSLETVKPLFGQRTIYDDNSNPGGRQSYCSAHRTIEEENSLWLFGGHGYLGSGDEQKMNDIWEFDLATKQWRYWSGDPDGGEQIVKDESDFHQSNNPGSWSHMICWSNPHEDQLYISMGKINDLYTNEIWVWNYAMRMFKRVKPPRTTEFGDGSYSESNTPPPMISWINWVGYDGEDTTYLYGAWARDDEVYGHGYTDDLWAFSNSQLQWKFLKGSARNEEEGDPYYTYTGDVFKIYNDDNMPSRRCSHVVFYNGNKLWIFGGANWTPDLIYLNDLWAYSLELGQWTLVSGDPDGGYFAGLSVKEFEYNEKNIPPTGAGQASFVGGNNLYIFGGHSFDFVNMWSYSIVLDQWKFVYGFFGEQIPVNYDESRPGSRDNGMFVYPLEKQDVWYYIGGACYNDSEYHSDFYCNDVWEYRGHDCFSIAYDEENVCNSAGDCTYADTCECEGINSGVDCGSSRAVEIVFTVLGIIAASIVAVIIVGIVVALAVVIIITLVNQKKKLKQYDAIGGKILLEEAEAEKRKSKAKINVNMKLFQIPWENIQIIKQIGQGGSDTRIFMARWNNSDCVFKQFQTNFMWSNQKEFSDFEKEIAIVSSIHHPNIIAVYGASIRHPRVGILQEYAENGTLDQYIRGNPGKLDLSEKIRLFKEIASALSYLHGRDIIHRDLKCPNVLLDSALKIKIIDFGLSKVNQKDSKFAHTVRVGTAWYMAPEVVLSGKYNEKVDIYSFAIIMFEVLEENFNPYGMESRSGVEVKAAKDPDFRPIFVNEKLYPDYLLECIKLCWGPSHKERHTAEKIYEVLESKEGQKTEIKKE